MNPDPSSDTPRPADRTFGSPDDAAAAALCASAVATTARLGALFTVLAPSEALRLVVDEPASAAALMTGAGCRIAVPTVEQWAAEATVESLDAVSESLRARRESVWWPSKMTSTDDCVMAELFAEADDAPAVLFWRGDASALRQPRVAIVGTRNATSSGREMARMLGRELADRGIGVVSGLALGIDAAAHAGALASAGGRPIGVVGSGLDVVYPPANRRLWGEVAERGLLISELAHSRGPTPATFPARNRIIAQVSQVVVVVESGTSGGSLITVDRAEERGRPILAVPGSPLSPVSAGTNELLRHSTLLGARAEPCLGVADVLTLLDVEVVTDPAWTDDRLQPSDADERVLLALGWDDLSVGAIAGRLTQDTADPPPSLGDVALALARLESQGWVSRVSGRWRRVGVAR